MSIADEILRIQQAKSDLATSIANKGVTVPAAATIDGYAALVDQIQQGGGGLPYDAEVEWIGVRQGVFVEASDYVPTGNGISIDMVVTFVSYPTTQTYARWYSAHASSSQLAYWFIQGNGTNKLVIYHANTESAYTSITTTIVAANTKYHVHTDQKYFEMLPVNSSISSWTVNTNHSGTANTAGFTLGDENLTRGINLNIHSFTVRDYGTVVLDYIPVRVGQVGYFYDKVGKKLYGKHSSSTTDLVVGNDKT